MKGEPGFDARQYLEVLETGALEPMTEGPHREMMFIKAENEKLADGGVCKAALTDDDPLHIQEHKNIIADPELRMSNDPKAAAVVQNVLTHITEHEQNFIFKQSKRPVLMGLLKQGPPAGAPPPPGAKPPLAIPPRPGAPAAGPVRPTAPAGAGAPPRKPGAMPRKQMPIYGGMKPTVPMPQPAQPVGGAH